MNILTQKVWGVILLITGGICAFSFPSIGVARYSIDQSEIMAMVVEEAKSQGVDPALALAVAQVESDFNASVVSHKGARGVMQIMPKTSQEDFGVNPSRLFDARTNIRIGVTFIKQLQQRYGKVEYALSHYNGGSRVTRSDGSLQVIPATRGYVKKVLAKAKYFRANSTVMLATGGYSSNQDSEKGPSYIKVQKRAERLRQIRQKNLQLAKVVGTKVDPYLQRVSANARYQAVAIERVGYHQSKRQQVAEWESVYRH